MLKKANISWSVKQVVKMIRNGNIKFDNAVQRGYEWDKKRASLLVHSENLHCVSLTFYIYYTPCVPGCQVKIVWSLSLHWSPALFFPRLPVGSLRYALGGRTLSLNH